MSLLQKSVHLLLVLLLFSNIACQANLQSIAHSKDALFSAVDEKPKPVDIASAEIKKMLESAIEQTNVTKNYDPNYVVIAYPNGDVPMETGVCSDVVIRAFRKAGIDLQYILKQEIYFFRVNCTHISCC